MKESTVTRGGFSYQAQWSGIGTALSAPIPLLPLIYYKRNATGAEWRCSYTAPLCLIAKTSAG